MITAKQREVDFRRELQELLDRHLAELDITDDGRSYGMQSGICRVSMAGVYSDGEILEEYTEFLL